MLSAVKSGLGVAYLPCYMAQADTNLVALQAATPLRELWSLVHPEKRHLAKIRAFLDWLTLEIFDFDMKPNTIRRSISYGRSSCPTGCVRYHPKCCLYRY